MLARRSGPGSASAAPSSESSCSSRSTCGRTSGWPARPPWRAPTRSARSPADAATRGRSTGRRRRDRAHRHRRLVDTPVERLSTGQRRLVELARVLAGPFDTILLDEPSSGLDPAETAHFGEILTGPWPNAASASCSSSTTWPWSSRPATRSTCWTSAPDLRGHHPGDAHRRGRPRRLPRRDNDRSRKLNLRERPYSPLPNVSITQSTTFSSWSIVQSTCQGAAVRGQLEARAQS